MPETARIACFVTPHGFGHAARAAALLAALAERRPGLEIEIWSSVPPWFFEESLGFPFHYRELSCDVGPTQKSPVEEDLPATVAALERFWSAGAEEARTRRVAEALVAASVRLVICDIAPFGLVAAREAGIPSVLFENFTWDWIYAPLVESHPRFAPWVSFLHDRFALADLRLQLEPVCAPRPGAICLPPVARTLRHTAGEVRERLAVQPGQALVLVSLGGIEHRLEGSTSLVAADLATIVVLGASDREIRNSNVRLLPHHSPVYHPDLIAAADLVVGKLGYSTVAEVVSAGTRMLFVPRPAFRESAVLEAYVRSRLPAEAISMAELESGRWVERIPELLARERPAERPVTGAEDAAAIVVARFL